MPFLRQSTAQVIRLGPFLDITDAVTEEVALTLTQAEMRLSKDGGAFAQKSAAGNATHDSDGWYSTTLSTTDTDTVGELKLNVQQPANALPVWEKWFVIEEAVYDALYAAGAAGYNTVTPPTAAANADAVWDEARAGHTTGGTYGENTGDAAMRGTDGVDTATMRGTDGVDTATMRGTDSAALASVATEARLAELDAGNLPSDVDAILADVTGLNGDAMRGTDGVDTATMRGTDGVDTAAMRGTDAAALASVATEARLAELDAANLPAAVDAILVDTTGLNGDAMRGTDVAALASVATEGRLAELDAANLPADVDAILADTTGLNGDAMRGTDAAALAVNYTAGRATNLDNLDVSVASRSSHNAADVAVATLDSQVEAENGGLSLQEVMSLINAVLAGRSTANGLTFLTPDGVATRVVATVDANKNRTSVVITPSA